MVIFRLLDRLKIQMSKACIDRSDSLIFQHKRRPRVTKYKKTYFGFTYASSEVHFRSTESQTFYRSIMTVDESIKCRCTNSGMTGHVGWFSKSRGLSASVTFLSSPPPSRSFTCAIFRTVFDSRSLFFAPKPHRNACYAGWVIFHFSSSYLLLGLQTVSNNNAHDLFY